MKTITLILSLLTMISYSKNTQKVEKTKGQVFELDSLRVQSEFTTGGYFFLDMGREDEYVVTLSRNFNHEIFEFMDREIIEVKNDEN